MKKYIFLIAAIAFSANTVASVRPGRGTVVDSSWVEATMDSGVVNTGIRVEGGSRQKGAAVFGATGTTATIGTDGTVTSTGFTQGSNGVVDKTGTPTANAVPKFSDTNTLTVSQATDDGTTFAISETLGSELVTGTSAMSAWTPTTGWTWNTNKWDHATGNTGALTVAVWTPTAATNYKIVFTITTSTAGSGITLAVGGVNIVTALSTAGTYTYYVRATATTALTFTPGSAGTWVGSITVCSVKAVTNGDVTAVNGTFAGSVSVPAGSNTYPSIGFRDASSSGMYYVHSVASPSINWSLAGTRKMFLYSGGFGLADAAAAFAWRTASTFLFSDANNQLDQRNSTAANIFNVYGTYASATSYERAFLRTTATAGEIGTEKGAGGGTARPLNVYTDGTLRAVFGSAGNLSVVSGTISGSTPVKLDNAGATVTITSDSCKGHVRINTVASAKDYTLPGAEAGLVVMIYDLGGGVITIDPADGTDTIYLDGASVGAGDAIDSPGAVSNYISLMAIDDTRWITMGRSGTWVDGGAD